MLYALSIKNFAIVERLELTFETGLTVITGETGAGKSILVDALGLALGDRADNNVVRQGCAETEISATFEPTPAVLEWLRAQGLDSEGECLARRVVSLGGRSRAYINNHLTTVQALRELGGQLVDIHSQHAHQSLLKPDTQREIVDGMADTPQAREAVAAAYLRWKTLRQALHALGGKAADREAQIALLRYQVEELAALDFSAASIAELDEEHRRLGHASQLLEGGQQALAWVSAEEGLCALSALHNAQRELAALQPHDVRLAPLLELLDSAAIEAQEAAEELRHYLEHLEIDPARLRWVEERIAALQDMARKHRVAAGDLPARQQALAAQLDQLEHYEEHARQLESELAAALSAYRAAAQVLSEQRLRLAQDLSQRITANVRQLGIPKGRLLIQVKPEPDAEPHAHGHDHIEFLVSANPGQDPRRLNKVASGGELSRISLGIQVLTAQGSGVPTLIFDEVDVGVGGGVAEIVGRQLAALSAQRQILCITHLPQVAAWGCRQVQVRKTSTQDSTQTTIVPLDEAQRVQELARMLGGLEITAQTIAHAREMLSWREKAGL